MPYIPKEEIEKAKQMDLLTYMRNYEPYELKHVKGNTYQLMSHDSLKISNGMWMWWSEGIGGKSALDFLIKVRGMKFTDAVETILGNVEYKTPEYHVPDRIEEKKLYIPEAYHDMETAWRYLVEQRGLDEDVMVDMYMKGVWYETDKYHSVAFCGKDMDDNIRLVTLRGTNNNFKNTTTGSDRHYPVRIVSDKVRNNVVHLFEAPIDMFSYMTLMKHMGTNYKEHNFLALCGIYQPKENIEESAVPIGLTQYLKDYPFTKTVCLHLDNDKAGIKAAEALQVVVGKLGLRVINQPPPPGYKDCNDFLLRGSVAALDRGNTEPVREGR